MKRIGCTNGLATRALCAAAGLALVSSLATAQSTTARAAEAKANQIVTAIAPDQLLGETVGVAGNRIVEFIGIDGSFCPLGSTPEGEPCVVPVMVPDTFNGGCNTSAANPPLTPIAVGQLICGQSARALDPADNVIRRDTDWYVVNIAVAGNYVVEVLTDTANVVGGMIGNGGGQLLNPTCDQVTQINPFVAAVGGGTTPSTLLQVGTYWLFASSSTAVQQPCFEYTIRIVPESAFFGACCQVGGVCDDVTAAGCLALGGAFQGVGTACATITCPDIQPPDNNECETAQAILAANVNGADIAGTNLAASPAFGLPTCGGPLTGPAVWYVYNAGTLGFQTVTVSTCNTTTLPVADRNSDTVINVFTNNIPDFCLGTFCCKGGNDDAADPDCGLYSEVSFCADPTVDGGQYFIVVSGFAGAQGDFLLTVTGDGVVCDESLCVTCQVGDVAEGELCPNAPDAFNGGCNSTPNVFSSLALNQTVCGTVQAQGGTRDTDWYEILIADAGDYEVVFEAGFTGVSGFLGATAGVPLVNPTCAQIAVVAVLTTPAACEEGIATATLQPGIYWVFASSIAFEGVSCPDAASCPGNGQYRLMVRPAAAIVPCPVECPAGAVAECEDCANQTPPVLASDCCAANGSPGCDDAGCQAIVCAIDTFCCDTEWDAICADLAIANCGTLCEDAGSDSCNDGCNNATAFAAQAIACGDTVCGTITAGVGLRDTDWYEVEVTNPAGAVITASLDAAFNGVVFILSVPDCDTVAILGETGFSSCVNGVASGQPAVASVGPGTYVVFVSSGNPDGSGIFEGITCETNADYVLTVTGDCDAATCPCPADLNGDCIVDAQDLGILLNAFGSGGPAGDINNDGIVDAADLGILLNNFGCQG